MVIDQDDGAGLTDLATRVVQSLRARGWTVATGESLTAGMVSAVLAAVPGASSVLRGGVVAYAPDVKNTLLGVPMETLERGIVSEEVALAMADGARVHLQAHVGVGTTGAAGPEPHDGQPAGTACLAVSTPHGSRARTVRIPGARSQVRQGVTAAALEEVLEAVEDSRAQRE